ASSIMCTDDLAESEKQEGLVCRAQPPLGAHERRHHARLAERASCRTVEMAGNFRREVEPLVRRKAPDQVIFGLAGPRDLRAQLQPANGNLVGAALAVAPGRAPCIFEQVRAAAFKRQPWRSDKATHPGGEQVV